MSHLSQFKMIHFIFFKRTISVLLFNVWIFLSCAVMLPLYSIFLVYLFSVRGALCLDQIVFEKFNKRCRHNTKLMSTVLKIVFFNHIKITSDRSKKVHNFSVFSEIIQNELIWYTGDAKNHCSDYCVLIHSSQVNECIISIQGERCLLRFSTSRG